MANLRLTFFLLLQLISTCYTAATSLHSRGLTNADRLKRGLPLKSPVFRRGTPTRRDSSPSNVPVPITYRGRVQVLDATTGSPLGWLSEGPSTNLVDSQSDAVQIELSTYPGVTSGLIAKCLSCSTTQNLGLKGSSITAYAYFSMVGTVPVTNTVSGIIHQPQVWTFDSSNNALQLSYTKAAGNIYTTMKLTSNKAFWVTPSATTIKGTGVKLQLVPLS
ncbi:hypothetical protein DL96DRAFT_1804124 [Flagelloscypha sp. PMI_526]|nr:hypothetical protein DL96DRAFT_1804124 [Flagelloscypha sp. PMI_526]